MLFGLFGCTKKINKSAEEIAQTYLEEKYHKEFVVEELTKKDAGSFETKEYSGFAYEKDNPKNRFKVWVVKSTEKVTDAYYCVSVIPEAEKWIQQEAESVWNNVKTGIVLEVLRADSSASYNEDEYLKFFQEASVETYIYLFVESKDEITLENYSKFDEEIKDTLHGYVQIFIVGENELSSINVTDYYDKNPDISIRIGASSSVIQKALQ